MTRRRDVVVTGGSGYFGTTLVRRLVEAGHSVRNFDLHRPEGHPPGAEHVAGDVRDRTAVVDAVRGADVVLHAVAQQPLARDRRLIQTVTVDGTANVLHASRSAGVSKVVFLSTTAVFGVPPSNPVTEATPVAPVEVYGRAKVEAEARCHDAVRDGLDVTVIRPRTIVGHGRLGLFSILFDWVADGAPVFVLGRGDNQYQFVHADDLASACLLAADRPGPTTYNVGAAVFGTMRETLQALVDHAATGSEVRSLPVGPAVSAMAVLSKLRLAPFGAYHWLAYGKPLWFDITKARQELGWEPAYSNAAMITEAYDWFLANRSTLGGPGRSLHQSPTRQGVLRLAKPLLRVATRRSR